MRESSSDNPQLRAGAGWQLPDLGPTMLSRAVSAAVAAAATPAVARAGALRLLVRSSRGISTSALSASSRSLSARPTTPSSSRLGPLLQSPDLPTGSFWAGGARRWMSNESSASDKTVGDGNTEKVEVRITPEYLEKLQLAINDTVRSQRGTSVTPAPPELATTSREKSRVDLS